MPHNNTMSYIFLHFPNIPTTATIIIILVAIIVVVGQRCAVTLGAAVQQTTSPAWPVLARHQRGTILHNARVERLAERKGSDSQSLRKC